MQPEFILNAIDKAEKFESKLSDEAIRVPFLGSLKIRALLNNLGAGATHFLEIGSHKGGSFCSTVFANENIETATVIDSWESDHMQGEGGESAYLQFVENANRFRDKNTHVQTIIGDCWEVDLNKIRYPIDLYSYDAGHSYEDQKKALTYYTPAMAKEFVYTVDDYNYGDVKSGTLDGIKEAGLKVILACELSNTTQGDDLHLNDEWWRGYGVFLLRKP